ncbi:RNA methyltransferase [Enterococcus cecorum]|nr:RNA methyltransferase [Enterococcus cecorum]
MLDYVQDPGNVGTMIRTADAAGFDGVILGEGCADVYATKTLRSMQGSQFHLKVIQADLSQVIQQLKAAQVKVYATELNKEAKQYQELPYHENVAIIMGNEGQGVRSEILKLADESVYIPIYGQAESLNVGVAAGIMMYGLIRKK